MTETALALAPAPSLQLNEARLQALMQYAQALAASNLLPAQYRGRPANVLWAIEYGKTINLTPMAAMLGVHVIEGKPSASAGLISGLVRRAGHRLRVRGDDTKATCEIVRSDDPEYTFRAEWTLDRAASAGLTGKSVWKQYPAAMLKARAVTECARDACEEILFGLHYTPEELGAAVDAEGEPVISEPAAVTDLRPQSAPEPTASTGTPVQSPMEVAPAPYDATVRMAEQAAGSADPKAIRGLYMGLHRVAREVDVSERIPPPWRALVAPVEPKVGDEGPIALKWWLWGCMQFAQANGMSVAEAAFAAAEIVECEPGPTVLDPDDEPDEGQLVMGELDEAPVEPQ